MIQLAMAKVCSIRVVPRMPKPRRLTHTADRIPAPSSQPSGGQGGLVDCADHLSSFRGYRGNSLAANSSWLSEVFTLTEHHDD